MVLAYADIGGVIDLAETSALLVLAGTGLAVGSAVSFTAVSVAASEVGHAVLTALAASNAVIKPQPCCRTRPQFVGLGLAPLQSNSVVLRHFVVAGPASKVVRDHFWHICDCPPIPNPGRKSSSVVLALQREFPSTGPVYEELVEHQKLLMSKKFAAGILYHAAGSEVVQVLRSSGMFR